MKNTFKITYNDRTYDIPKERITFEHGYALVQEKILANHAYRGSTYSEEIIIRGIIDENFNVVLPLKGYYANVIIFPQGNILVTVRSGDDQHTTYHIEHYKIIDGTSTLINKINAWECDIIDETTIKTINNVFDTGFEAFYDLIIGKYISEEFTTIGAFTNSRLDSDEKLAMAVKRLRFPNFDKQKVCDVICFINKKGKISTPIYDEDSDEYFDTDTDDFNYEETIERIRQNIAQNMIKKSVAANNLTSWILPKKN